MLFEERHDLLMVFMNIYRFTWFRLRRKCFGAPTPMTQDTTWLACPKRSRTSMENFSRSKIAFRALMHANRKSTPRSILPNAPTPLSARAFRRKISVWRSFKKNLRICDFFGLGKNIILVGLSAVSPKIEQDGEIDCTWRGRGVRHLIIFEAWEADSGSCVRYAPTPFPPELLLTPLLYTHHY